MMIRLSISVVCGMRLAIAHGEHEHHHDRARHNHNGRSETNKERKFTVGGVVHESREDFFRWGGKCQSPQRTPKEEARVNDDFKTWKETKEKRKMGGLNAEWEGRRLAGCDDCVRWTEQIITVPVHFHVIHDGNTGINYTYGSDRSYIERSIKALNFGFQGITNPEFTPYSSPNLFDVLEPSRSYGRYNATEADSKIRLCLAGTTTTNSATWYYAGPHSVEASAMKQALHVNGPETLNVYVSQLGGYFGHATMPPPNEPNKDGVVILNEVMPGGPHGPLSEGDTLTHEVGHWLGLVHTHTGYCAGEGDYMNPKSTEASMSFGCPVRKDDCPDDGGPNPIHNFMSYTNVRISHHRVKFFHHHGLCLIIPVLLSTSTPRTIVWINSPLDRSSECSSLGKTTGMRQGTVNHLRLPLTGSCV